MRAVFASRVRASIRLCSGVPARERSRLRVLRDQELERSPGSGLGVSASGPTLTYLRPTYVTTAARMKLVAKRRTRYASALSRIIGPLAGSIQSAKMLSTLLSAKPVMNAATTPPIFSNGRCSLSYGAARIPAAHPTASPRAVDVQAIRSLRQIRTPNRTRAISPANPKLLASLMDFEVKTGPPYHGSTGSENPWCRHSGGVREPAPLRGGELQGGLISGRRGIDSRSFGGPGACGALHGDSATVDDCRRAARGVAVARLDAPLPVVWLAAAAARSR